MSSFTDDLVVKIEQGERDGRGLATVRQPFEFHVGSYPSEDVIVVPAGFVTDFTSVPWWAQRWVSVLGRHAKAAVVHDYLIDQTRRPYRECNRIFAEALRVLGVRGLRYLALVLAVNLHYGFKQR